MAKKPLFFIYGRREMGILILLAVSIALFAFTLGIHLGKQVEEHGQKLAGDPKKPHQSKGVDTASDVIPDRLEIADQGKKARVAAESTLQQVLHNEVERTGIQLDTPRQIRLPEKTVSADAGKTTPQKEQKSLERQEEEKRAAAAAEYARVAEAKMKELAEEKAAQEKAAQEKERAEAVAKKEPAPEPKKPVAPEFATGKLPSGKYTIQVGSHPKDNLAREQLEQMEALGLEAFSRPADVKGKQWFRVYLGGFDSQREARETGVRYKKQHVIDSFMVSKMPKEKK